MITIRHATSADVVACTNVWRSTVDADLPEVSEGYQLYQHEIDSGTLLVADNEGEVVGFGGSLTRGERWFLADLFVNPRMHGHGVGRQLLNSLVEHDKPGLFRATMASSDPRALTLYTEHGMAARWPCFSVEARDPKVPTSTPAEPCTVGELLAVAAASGYSLSEVDLGYWMTHSSAECALVGGEHAAIGGAVIQRRTPFSVDDPGGTTTIGPVFAVDSAKLLSVINAVLVKAVAKKCRGAESTGMIKLYVPGPSGVLAAMLSSGFRIVDFDLYSATEQDSATEQAVLDSTKVLPSHDLL